MIKRQAYCDKCGREITAEEIAENNYKILWEPKYLNLFRVGLTDFDPKLFRQEKHYCSDHDLISLTQQRDQKVLDAQAEINKILTKYFGQEG